MKEFFVSYNEAMQMRDLQFNEPCMAHYEIAMGIMPPVHLLHSYPMEEQKPHLLLAPTHEQAFKWLRDNTTLPMHPSIVPVDSWKSWSYIIISQDATSLYEIKPDISLEFQAFEDAQTACLKHMLSLLKPVKQETV
jgi:hypothetical protein